MGFKRFCNVFMVCIGLAWQLKNEILNVRLDSEKWKSSRSALNMTDCATGWMSCSRNIVYCWYCLCGLPAVFPQRWHRAHHHWSSGNPKGENQLDHRIPVFSLPVKFIIISSIIKSTSLAAWYVPEDTATTNHREDMCVLK